MRECRLVDKNQKLHRFPCYEVSEIPWKDIRKSSMHCNHQEKSYSNRIAAFDIENTSMLADGNKVSFMYHWQFCIDGILVYGRYWGEFKDLLRRLKNHLCLNDRKFLCIYVHNLGHEYQFMKAFLEEEFGELEIFAPQPRKPLKVTSPAGFEFRCSWKLSNMSLYYFTKNELGCNFVKRKGDLDYRVVRAADTPLTDKEFDYCMADVYTLYEAIKARLINHHDTLDSIPLTSTGYVRRDCRNACKEDTNYRKMFKSLRISEKQYQMLKSAARGGDTHANRQMAGRIWRQVDSYDVQSSYPAMMLLREFPMTAFTPYGEVETKEELEEILSTKACLFKITAVGVRQKKFNPMPYIPDAKCSSLIKPLLDNGRVLKADALEMHVTDIDYKIIRDQYTFDELYISEMQVAEYGPLPKPLRDTVYNYFKAKCDLKYRKNHCKPEEKIELEYLYDRSKNSLNGIFGMMFTDPVHDEVFETEEGKWKRKRPENIAEKLEKYQNSRNSFLYYPWGVWITAHARAHLAKLVACGGDTAIYCDTDSLKGFDIDKAKIDQLNEEIMQECEEKGAYAEVNGEKYYLGIYEHETKKSGPYKYFETLGAKKYCYKDSEGLHLTVSGVNKEQGAAELQNIYRFRPGFTFHKAGGQELTYLNAPIYNITINGCTMETASAVHFADSTYRLTITPEYADLIEYIF